MVDLSTSYLGFKLAHPLVPGASPLADDLDGVRRLVDAGAPMITLRSLIAAPLSISDEVRLIDRGEIVLQSRVDPGEESYPPRSVFAGLHDAPEHACQPDKYCEHIQRVRQAIDRDIPIVASLYARRMQQWISNAKSIEEADADALELNIYGMAIAPDIAWKPVQQQIVELVYAVKREIRIPVAVKLLPFYKSFDQFVRKLPKVGADALVLYNGFYRSDCGVDPLSDPFLHAMSSPLDPHYRLRWLARLSGRIGIDLAYSGGARNSLHAIKAVMCGAAAVQIVSALIRHGPKYLRTLRDEMAAWMEEHDYESVQQLRGKVSMQAFDSVEAFDMAYNSRILVKPQ